MFTKQVNISLECMANDHLKSLKRKYIRVSSQATVTQIKKFIAKYVCDGMEKYKDVSNILSLLFYFCLILIIAILFISSFTFVLMFPTKLLTG